MKQFLIQFQGFSDKTEKWETYIRLVIAESYEEACSKIVEQNEEEWQWASPYEFKNLTIS